LTFDTVRKEAKRQRALLAAGKVDEFEPPAAISIPAQQENKRRRGMLREAQRAIEDEARTVLAAAALRIEEAARDVLETLAAAIALAVFLPMVSDMSGCSGNQAVAVSIRELALGITKPFELLRVWLQEVKVGLINGVVLGTLLAAVSTLWKGNPWLGLVIGSALALNTVIAVSLGGTIPLLLKRMKFDPAVASGPILTTLTDICGFFLVLSFATAILPKLTV
jgi:magnesium transporter